MTEEEISAKSRECEEIFALENWLPNAARRAGQISLSTHPVTFSHPSARKNKNGYASAIVATGKFSADGFLRTGNVQVEPDALGNAAALDVHKFLTLVMQDGNTLLQHLQKESELAKQLLGFCAEPDAVRQGFLDVLASNDEIVTSSKIKQVYFPVEEETGGYHLLSLLSHSGHLFELRNRLNELRFSEEVRSKRELKKNNQYAESGYQEIRNLTIIGYGGTKPQNISALNNKNAGKSYLLMSVPPDLSPRYTRLPTRNFFTDRLYANQMTELFQAFHRLVSVDYNNAPIRKGLDDLVQKYTDQLILKMWQVRQGFVEQTHARTAALPGYQKIWLLPEHEAERKHDSQWLDDLIREAARHFNACYKRVLGRSALTLGDDLMQRVTRIIERNREALL
jgi:CRISPR-associated protein Csy1